MELISVIIPAFNAERFLADAISSVVRQTPAARIELIVVDDGSTDGTASVVESVRNTIRRKDLTVAYHHQEHGGAGQARNTALLCCTGTFIAFLDADDLWEENKLLLQMEVLNNDESIQAVFGHVTEFVTGTPAGHRSPVQLAPAYLPGTMLARREVFDQVGLFETGLAVGEFVDWYSRALTQSIKTEMLPDVVLRRRLHDNNMGLSQKSSFGNYATILRAHLQRKREGNC
ncbi:MAG: glycosyltransferase family 2 protein [Terriglobales bacterium]